VWRVAHYYYLRTLRQRRGLTQAQLAHRSDLAQNSISRLERGLYQRPSFRTAQALAAALDVPVQFLRFGQDPKRADQPTDLRRRPAEVRA
jgi:transcriptional regulator with XRE-family HTH domain